MEPESDSIENETFDFAKGLLTDDDREDDDDEEVEEEVFFGPVSFKEECRERWVNDRCCVDFNTLSSSMRVEDWCEIFTNANLVASSLSAGKLSAAAAETPLSAASSGGDAPPSAFVSPFRRETYTLAEISLMTPVGDGSSNLNVDRRSAVSDASSYYTAKSNVSSPVSGQNSGNSSPVSPQKTPINMLPDLDLWDTPPTVKVKSRRSFLPPPLRDTTPIRFDKGKRRSASCENMRPTLDDKSAISESLNHVKPLRPALSAINVTDSRIRPPTAIQRSKLARPVLTNLHKNVDRSRLGAPSALKPPNSLLPRYTANTKKTK